MMWNSFSVKTNDKRKYWASEILFINYTERNNWCHAHGTHEVLHTCQITIVKQWSQNVGAGGPHHRSHQLMASSSLDCHRLVEWGRHNELEASMVGAASSHVLGSLLWNTLIQMFDIRQRSCDYAAHDASFFSPLKVFWNFNTVKLYHLAKISCYEFDTKQFIINFV